MKYGKQWLGKQGIDKFGGVGSKKDAGKKGKKTKKTKKDTAAEELKV